MKINYQAAIRSDSLLLGVQSSQENEGRCHLVYVTSDVFVLDDDEQTTLGVLLPQEGDGTLGHVALLQQVLLQTEAQTAS